MPSLTGRELNDFLLYPDQDTHPLGAVCRTLPAEDARSLYRLCDTLVERAALFVAVTLCAIVLKTGRGRTPGIPICITVDGTTFWQLRGVPLPGGVVDARVPEGRERARLGDRLRGRRSAAGRRHCRIDQLIPRA